MARSIQKKRKAQLRRQRKRETSRRRSLSRPAMATSAKGHMRSASRWPLLECRLGRSWRDSRLAQVLVSRRGPLGIAMGFFLVDLGCLGVKDCIALADLSEKEYREFIEGASEHEPLDECDPTLAVKIVQTGVAFASELGFRPTKDYLHGREIFGDIDPGACVDEVPCGKDGKPIYVAGPHDDVRRVMRQLESRLGREGFYFVAEASELDEELQLDEDSLQGLVPLEELDDPGAPPAERLREAESVLVPEMFQYAVQQYGEDILRAAWDDFWLRPGIPIAPDDQPEYGSVFVHWFVFNWIPAGTKGAHPRWPEVPIARLFLDDRGGSLSEFQGRFLETAASRPYSLYRVKKVRWDKYVDLRDLVTRRTYRVSESLATEYLRKGDVLFTRVVPMEGAAIMVGSAPWLVPAGEEIDLNELLERLAGTDSPPEESDLPGIARELRRVFFDAIREVWSRPIPEVCNTDREPIVIARLEFDLRCPPQRAFDRLKELAPEADEDGMLEDAEFDERGSLRTVSLPWLKPGNRVHADWDKVMGHVEIDGDRLAVEVYSERRAEEIRSRFAALLGKDAVLRDTKLIPLEGAVRGRAPAFLRHGLTEPSAGRP